MSEKNQEIRFTPQENADFINLRDNFRKNFYQLGQLRMEILFLEEKIQVLKENESGCKKAFEELRNQENALMKKVYDKYGDGTYNPETGVFTPAEKT